MDHIKSILKMEQVEEIVKDYVRKIWRKEEGSTQVDGGGKLGGELAPLKPVARLGAQIGVSVTETEMDKETVELIYRGLSVIDYGSIRNDLEVIIEQCSARAIVVLVDEWASVSLALQPILAEMIRKTLAVSNKIFLKIVSRRYFTRTSAILAVPQRVGLQAGIDINVLADLDELLCFDVDQQRVTNFLTRVAYRHTSLEIGELNAFPVNAFADYLTDNLFDSPSTYFEVVRASEGNPRDFLSILAECCRGRFFDREAKVTTEQVRGLANSHFQANKVPEISGDTQVRALFDRLFQRVIHNHSKLFLISGEKAYLDSRVQELWHHRFIHLINPCCTYLDEKDQVHEYVVYSMDYGKILLLKGTKRGEDFINLVRGVAHRASGLVDHDIISQLLQKGVDQVLLQPIFREPIIATVGPAIAQIEGVETADLTHIEHMVEHCVVDDLLDS